MTVFSCALWSTISPRIFAFLRMLESQAAPERTTLDP